MEQYVIDTNVISHYFNATIGTAGLSFLDSVINATPILSVVTQIELLCWKTDQTVEQNVKDFVNDSIVLDISTDVIAQCVALRKGKKMKLPDAVIAATALSYGYTLITNNERDFLNIKALTIVNPRRL